MKAHAILPLAQSRRTEGEKSLFGACKKRLLERLGAGIESGEDSAKTTHAFKQKGVLASYPEPVVRLGF
jgi:hypothetical protein